MQIKFDFETNITPNEYIKFYNSRSGLICNEIKSFIRQRWSVLEDELLKIDNAKVKITIIHNPNCIKLEYFDIPQVLVGKMEDSLSQDDYNYIGKKINSTFSDQA